MLTVELWSDIVCPWCYLGARRWRRALERSRHSSATRSAWRSFELRRDQPRTRGEPLSDLMARNYGMRAAEIDAVFARLRALGEREGVVLRPEEVRPVNSFDAHRLLHLAAEHGAAGTVAERLFAAYHGELLDIADPGVLRRLAAEAGLPDDAVARTLEGDAYAQRVRADEERAVRVGVTSVPSFVVGGRVRVQGAAIVDEMVAMLDQAHRDAN